MAQIGTFGEAIIKINSLDSTFQARERFKAGGNKENPIIEMRQWWQRCGHDAADLDKLNAIHVAGSKGKGSTSAFIFSILSQYLDSSQPQGQVTGITKLGLYTSPHLRTVRERIRFRGSLDVPFSETVVSEEYFTRCCSEVWNLLGLDTIQPGEQRPTFFRYLTLMALHGCLQEKVDTAVVEVGIGGEYDATNILRRPSICGITSLELEHTDLLGDTIEEIAWRKSGIMKPGCPVYTVVQPAGAMLILKQRAAEKNAPLEVVLPHPDVDSLPLGLAGDFQKINASLAVAVAAAHLRHMGYSEIPEDIMGTPLPEKFCRGLVEATWPGRCEIQHQAGVAWCLDGAHTLNSIKLIGTWFANKIKRESFPGQKRVLIFNQQSRDAVPLLDSLHKAIRTAGLCTERLKPFCHVIFCTNMTWENDKAFGAEQAPMMSSGNLIEDLQVQYKCASYWKLMKGEEHTDVTVVRSVEEAVNCARSLRQNCHEFPPPLCLITGSLHLVGSAMEVLEKCF